MAGFYNDISTKVLAVADAALNGQGAIITALSPIGLAAITVWIMWHGINTMRGATGSHAVGDLLVGLARVMLVFGVGVFGGAYGSRIAPAILGAAGEFAGFFGIDAQGRSIYQALDAQQRDILTMFQKVIVAATGLPWDSMVQGLGMILFGALLTFALTIYLVLTACILLGMDASLRVIVLLGPIFVFCLAFPKTESFFYPWFNTAVATALGMAALFIPIKITRELFNTWITSITTDATPDNYDMFGTSVTAIAAVLISYYLLMKMPQLIGGIIGSSVGGGGGIAQSMKRMAGVVSGAAGAASGAGARVAATAAVTKLQSASATKGMMNSIAGMHGKFTNAATRQDGSYTNPVLRALHKQGGDMKSQGTMTPTKSRLDQRRDNQAAKADSSK
jgi:type IV secretion system protein VirB6